MPDWSTFEGRINWLVEQTGAPSVRALGMAADLSPATIGNRIAAERNSGKPPGFKGDTLKKMRAKYGVSSDWLSSGVGDPGKLVPLDPEEIARLTEIEAVPKPVLQALAAPARGGLGARLDRLRENLVQEFGAAALPVFATMSFAEAEQRDDDVATYRELQRRVIAEAARAVTRSKLQFPPADSVGQDAKKRPTRRGR